MLILLLLNLIIVFYRNSVNMCSTLTECPDYKPNTIIFEWLWVIRLFKLPKAIWRLLEGLMLAEGKYLLYKNSTSVSRKKCWHTSFLALCTCQVSDLLDPLQILSTNRSTLVWTKLRYLLCENWLLVRIWHWNHIKPELPLLQILSKKRCQKVSQKYTNLKTHFK